MDHLILSVDYPAFVTFDNFKGQCTTELSALDNNNINVILIPPNCTDRLQPLDISLNKSVKDFCVESFRSGIQSRYVVSSREKRRKVQLICASVYLNQKVQSG